MKLSGGKKNMILKPVSIKDFDFSKYGVYYDMKHDKTGVSHSKTDVYEDHMTKCPLIDTMGHLGLTLGSSAPYTIKSMEKHQHTQEAIFCTGEPIILCFAASYGEQQPRAVDVRAVILEPGDVVVMDRNIWHDACHGIGKKTYYYYLATSGEKPAEWYEISDGPVYVEIER